MAKRTKKYLIDTSAVRAALGGSTPAQNAELAEIITDGTLWSSAYLRMEYIRRWVCDTIRMAVTISLCTNVSDAIVIIEQDFSPRNVKGALAVLANFLRERGAIANSRTAAEEVASLAVRSIERYDALFPKRVNGRVGCKKGATPLHVDFNKTISDLRQFYEDFNKPVTDCEVNKFLQLQRPTSKTKKLLDHPAAKKLTSVKNLQNLKDKGTWITCKECSKIGDAVIAQEQPPSWTLVHVDNSFNILCDCFDTSHEQVRSVLALAEKRIP